MQTGVRQHVLRACRCTETVRSLCGLERAVCRCHALAACDRTISTTLPADADKSLERRRGRRDACRATASDAQIN